MSIVVNRPQGAFVSDRVNLNCTQIIKKKSLNDTTIGNVNHQSLYH